jgi:hypothetical protein
MGLSLRREIHARGSGAEDRGMKDATSHLIVSAVFYTAGVIVIGLASSWLVGLGVFLMLWGHNAATNAAVARATEKREVSVSWPSAEDLVRAEWSRIFRP